MISIYKKIKLIIPILSYKYLIRSDTWYLMNLKNYFLFINVIGEVYTSSISI